MTPAEAKQALRLVNRLTGQVLRSIEQVAAGANEHAANNYRRAALQVLDGLSMMVFELWERFPEHAPKDEPGVTYYDPAKWRLSKRDARRAAKQMAPLTAEVAARAPARDPRLAHAREARLGHGNRSTKRT